MSNTNIKVVYDFYNQQPETNGNKLNSLASKNATQTKASDNSKVKRSSVNTMNSKRSTPSTIKIEGEILDEESERDNRFTRPVATTKSSTTPNKGNISSVSKGKTSSTAAGKSVTKQPANKSKSPVRSVSPISKKIDVRETKPSKSPTRKPLNPGTPTRERLSESTSSINRDDLKSSRNGVGRDPNNSKQLPTRSGTPNARPNRLSNSQTKLNGSFNNTPETSNVRPKTPKPVASKNGKITPLNKLSSNNTHASTDNNDNNSENIREIKITKNNNTPIYNAIAKNPLKIAPVKMGLLTKKNVIEGTFADGDDSEASVNSPNKSRLDPAKDQNNANKIINILQIGKEEKESKQTKPTNPNHKKINTQDPGEMNNSYNLLNKKKIDLKFISTSPIIRVKLNYFK